jgi:colicin import membrane protein
MRSKIGWCAALVVTVGGCAGMRGGSSETGGNPGAQKVENPQQQTEQALRQASESQKKASEQQKRAAEAQREVERKQQELQLAQQKAQTEQQKAQQLQLEANVATEQGAKQAQRSQQQASRALSQQSARIGRGEQQLQGQVSQATSRQLVMQTQGGQAMTFDLDADTRIRIDGREATAAQIQPGENALVSYEVSGTQPTARVVQISTGNPSPSGTAPTPAQ